MAKSLFENELIAGMEQQLRKQALAEKPSLTKAADCLHAALEILEEQGLTARADQLLQILQKIGQANEARDVQEMPSLPALMEAGMTQRDFHEFSKGNPIAKAKFNLVLRSLGYSDHQIGNFIGKTNVMSEDDAKAVLDPNRSFSKIYDWMKDPTQPVDPTSPQPGETISMKSLPITGPGDTISFKSMKEPTVPNKDDLVFKSIAAKKPGRPDKHTKRLTPEKMLKNLEGHGFVFNLADDGMLDVPPPLDMNNLKESDFEPEFGEFATLLKSDIDDSDDLFATDINDTLEVSENDIPIDDFEDERD
jgi:hypothetical protein